MGVLNLVVVIITAGVAVIACVFAGLTYWSQLRSEKLQERTVAIQDETKKIQQETYDSQKRATEIQDRMDARDLEFRKSRAEASLNHLLHIIRSAANRASIDNSAPVYDDIVALMNGWQEDLMYLPECELKRMVNDKLPGLVAPGNETSAGGNHMGRTAYELEQLKTKLADGQLEDKCLEAIKNML